MKRAPIYYSGNNKLRICSMPNGQWQAQSRKSGEVKGQNAGKTTPHYDPWQALQSPTTYEAAMEKMNAVGHGD